MTPAELRSLFQQFTDAVSTDRRILQQVTAWSDARRQWRSQWEGRSSTSSALTLQMMVPQPASALQEGWIHPVADEAPELNTWKALWDAATLQERNELAAAFVSAIDRIERDPASVGDACAQLSRSAGRRGLPLAAVTPALSSLNPVRFMAICDDWLRMLTQHVGSPVPADTAVYSETNAIALRWLSAAEGDTPGVGLAGCPPADRFGMFCSWIARTTSEAKARAFDVTRKKYKEWPPMW